MNAAWATLEAAPAECAAFLNAVAANAGEASAEAGALQPDHAALCSVYCAAALTVSARLDVFESEGPLSAAATAAAAVAWGRNATGSETASQQQQQRSCPPRPSTGSAAEPTFAFSPRQVGPFSNRAEDAWATAAVIPAVVEGYLLPSKATFQRRRASLCRHAMGMPLLGLVLRGYAGYMLHASKNPTAASARCLRFLGHAVYSEDSPYASDDAKKVSSGGGGGLFTSPISPASPLPNQQQTTRLTVAHAVYVYVSRVAHLPAAGLSLLLNNPVLRFDMELDGVSLVDYFWYYIEGATLLAELGRYADAAECAYNAAVLNHTELFGKGANSEDYGVAAQTMMTKEESGRHFARRGTDPAALRRHRREGGLATVIPNGFVRDVSPWKSGFKPSQSEVMLAFTLYEHACKLAGLLTIMGFRVGGGGDEVGGDSLGASAAKASLPPLHRMTYIKPQLISQHLASLPTLALYSQLWRHAGRGDLQGFMHTVAVSTTALENDGLLTLAFQALERLRRFVILDMAVMYDTVPLQRVAEVACLHPVEAAAASSSSSPSEGNLRAAGVGRNAAAAARAGKSRDMHAQQDVVHLLTCMHEEGQLRVKLSYRAAAPPTRTGGNEEESQAEGEEGWVVTWALPTMLSESGRCDYLAHRATYGNCTSVGVDEFSSATSGVLPTPSATSAVIMESIRRADALRAHVAAAEKSVAVWKQKLQPPRSPLEEPMRTSRWL